MPLSLLQVQLMRLTGTLTAAVHASASPSNAAPAIAAAAGTAAATPAAPAVPTGSTSASTAPAPCGAAAAAAPAAVTPFSTSGGSLDSLPLPILELLLRHLDAWSVCHAASVNKTFHKVWVCVREAWSCWGTVCLGVKRKGAREQCRSDGVEYSDEQEWQTSGSGAGGSQVRRLRQVARVGNRAAVREKLRPARWGGRWCLRSRAVMPSAVG